MISKENDYILHSYNFYILLIHGFQVPSSSEVEGPKGGLINKVMLLHFIFWVDEFIFSEASGK
jgi:hypothetical protein